VYLMNAPKQPPPPGWAIFVACALFGIVVAAIPMTLRIYGDRRADRLLTRWAAASGHELCSRKLISFARGPNFFVWGGGTPDVRWDA
jgi:hypothetical protein